MKKICFPNRLVLFLFFTVFLSALTSASEVRTLELFPIADSFVSVSSPLSNFGSELHLRTEYEEKTIVAATSFDISAASRRVLDVSLPKNGMINGSLDVAGGGDIDFRIENEAENVTYVEEFSAESLNFYFFAPYTGNYLLVFENVGSSVRGRDMDWSWGSEAVPLEYPGFRVSITALGGGEYEVVLTPARIPGVVGGEWASIKVVQVAAPYVALAFLVVVAFAFGSWRLFRKRW